MQTENDADFKLNFHRSLVKEELPFEIPNLKLTGSKSANYCNYGDDFIHRFLGQNSGVLVSGNADLLRIITKIVKEMATDMLGD